MRSGSPVFQRTLIGAVEAGDALKAAARGKLHRGDVFILRKGLQRNDLLYADIVDEVPQIDADILADEMAHGHAVVAEVLGKGGERDVLVGVVVNVLNDIGDDEVGRFSVLPCGDDAIGGDDEVEQHGGMGIRLQSVEIRLSAADRAQIVEEGAVGFLVVQKDGRRHVRVGLVEGPHECFAEENKSDLRLFVAEIAVYLQTVDEYALSCGEGVFVFPDGDGHGALVDAVELRIAVKMRIIAVGEVFFGVKVVGMVALRFELELQIFFIIHGTIVPRWAKENKGETRKKFIICTFFLQNMYTCGSYLLICALKGGGDCDIMKILGNVISDINLKIF